MLAPPPPYTAAAAFFGGASEGTAVCGGASSSCWFVKTRPHRFVAARAGLSSFFLAPIRLDSQSFRTTDMSQLQRIGPVPGDITELEAYIRIFRAAEKLQAAIMDALCNPETGECTVSHDIPSQDLPMLEEKVVAVLGCMLALVNRAREDVLSGRSSVVGSFQIDVVSVIDGKLPPLAIFRGEMKRCCESLQIALSKYLPPFDDRNREIWKWLNRLQNICYDAGFPRPDEYPCPAVFANWSPVYSSRKEDGLMDDNEVAFWQGGQVTAEGLAWLLKNKFKTIVDLREESAMDEHSQAALNEAVLSGKVKVVNIPIDVGTAPSMEQVEQFALLVMDSTRLPVYLHSKEGIGRTSAMVSRWRQFTMLPLSHSVSSAIPSQNGRPTKNATHYESKNRHSTVSLETRSRTCLEDEVNYLSRKVTTGNHDEPNSEVDDTNLELHLKLDMETYPLKAQVPPCNIFSKKEMTAFYKSRKLSPQIYTSNCRSKLEVLPSFDGSAKLPVQRNKTLTDSQWVEHHSRGLSRKPGAGNFLRTDFTNTINGTAAGKNSESFVVNADCDSQRFRSFIGNPNSLGYFDNKHGKQIVVAGTESLTMESGDYVDPEISTLALNEENMCASETGVVRVQSRKKAEMFLVRTDGFSCTREKVTEATMAFTHPSTQQQMLMWKSPPKTVLLLKKLGHSLMEEAKEIASFLHYQAKMNVLVEPDVHDIFARMPGFGFVQTFYHQDTSDLHDRVDFVTCLGGDGVILHASNLFRGPVPPVVSFNLGSLGFLTSHEFSEYKKDLTAVIHGNNTLGVYITLRMRLRCEIFRNGKAVPGKVFDVLNEVIVDRGSNPYLSKIECYEHNRLITKVQGDGVIIATPTGSTAYSTAAGGSMVHPNVPCMLFTPICPHSLSFRPVILPDSARLELKIPQDARNNAWVSFDGKRRQQLTRGDSVHISMSQYPLPTVNKADQTGDWFRSLIRCLNWNERLEQKAL